MAAAVVVLYVLHFTEKKTTAVQPMAASSSIVFVNSDSLINNYEFIKKKKAELESKHDAVKQQLNVENEALKKEADEYRKKAQAMTDEERKKTEEKLMEKQQGLLQKRDEMLSKLDDEQEKIYADLFENLRQFMAEFNKGKNYGFILGYQKGGGILYANDSLNITNTLVDELNKWYHKSQ